MPDHCAPRLPAPTDSKGQRWAACPRCKRGHLLGELMWLDEFGPEQRVPWPCPRPGSPPFVVAVDPLFWDEPAKGNAKARRDALIEAKYS